MRTLAIVVASLFVAADGYAIEDCPPGSVPKNEDGFAWCEPTVCLDDSTCKPQEVCKNVPLCLEVGSIHPKDGVDGGQRLVATKRCGPDKTCPQRETCSDLRRCIGVAAAEKMGLLEAAPATPAKPEAKKSACGCDVIGAPPSPAVFPALLGLVFLARRYRTGTPRKSRSF